MIVDALTLRATLPQVCRDADLDPDTLVVWVVDARRPAGATPIAYLQPHGVVQRDTVQVFRAVGSERAAAFAGTAHRLAVWRDVTGLPDSALGPMVRHELAHAARWQRSGPAFYAADERLRASLGGASYAQLPTEREANAAAAAYARRVLTETELAELAAVAELADLLGARPPADVVGETLALIGEEVEVAAARLAARPGAAVVELVPPASCGMW